MTEETENEQLAKSCFEGEVFLEKEYERILAILSTKDKETERLRNTIKSYETQFAHFKIGKLVEEYAAMEAKLKTMSAVVEAARNINPWCIATHGHVPGGWVDFLKALEEMK